jgi:hypothetical protein
MQKILVALAVAIGAALPAHGASLTLGSLVDGDGGTSFDIDGRFSPVENWSIGAGGGRSELALTGADFRGNSLRLSSDLQLGGFSVSVSAQDWKDSNQIKSTNVLGQFGWMADSGFSVSALVDDRNLTVHYTATVLGQARERSVDFDGTGFGADLSYFGEQWSLGARFIDYSYGQSVARARAVLESPTTTRYPRLQNLLASAVTRAAGAPDREISATVGRQFSRTSLQGDWSMQRDALTGTDINSLSMVLGYEVNKHFEIDTTVGFSDGGADGTVAFGGVALTLRN